MSLPCSNSYFEINMHKIMNNYISILHSIPKNVHIIPILKGNAYGYGAVEIAKALTQEESVQLIGLSQIGEGIELRNAGIQTSLLIMGSFPMFQLPLAVANNLQLTVFRPDQLLAIEEECSKQSKTIGIHIKIETGLNRIGVKIGQPLDELLDTLKKLTHLHLEGVFTHFIDGEILNSPLAKKQFALYQKALEQIRDKGMDIPLCHICNSGASDWYKDAYLDAIRIGRRLYMPSQFIPQQENSPGAVEEVASWRTWVVNVHTVETGENVGYDGVFVAKRPTKVATICVGYGDGLYTGFVAAGSPCLVNGNRSKYIGICMDQSFLDVTDIPCSIGDEVTIFGESSLGTVLTAQELGKTVGHEGVFFTDNLNSRVERRYIWE